MLLPTFAIFHTYLKKRWSLDVLLIKTKWCIHRAFRGSEVWVCLRTMLNCCLFNLKRLTLKCLTTEVPIRILLFTDHTALTAHNEVAPWRHIDSPARACDIFKIISSVKNAEASAQGTDLPPEIKWNGDTLLKTLDKFICLGYTKSSTCSLA